MAKVFCANGGWVYGTMVPFPLDAAIYRSDRQKMVACSQLFCSSCEVPVKHMEGVANIRRWPKTQLSVLYASQDPDLWTDEVDRNAASRLYYCECSWYSTPGGTQVGHLDTKEIDTWSCAGHPAP